MVKSLRDWIAEDVDPVRGESVKWLSENYFFRDPMRHTHVDPAYFFSPADGVVLYQGVVEPDAPVVDIKGSPHTVRDAIRDDGYDRVSLVIGIFMTFYDVHVNRVPYSGRLTYRELDAIDTVNRPMLDVEKEILERLRVPAEGREYLRHNQRVVNRVDSAELGRAYHLLQLADYDVDAITPFTLAQHRPVRQGSRFSQIRFGSQVDLIIPVGGGLDLQPLCEPGQHVQAGLDPLVRVVGK
ncbi:phosphatidylserine decarboxylase [Saccharothrix algeriensis]|uniref:Phosphatidylserine decarboxylase n=1 Tax=Saccharothrix algeriensis TaxID=173560 RepID=A0A8T8HZE4_9PSEU|nr:phosphatidylserine decarboxylase [Saccharothrix algeriensis]MBM7809651.1 phosphatidylserine decarboxylase [Saccharothrix algeriensis]QTR03955.1 phosphatidylserine decarboxylase [Saccharothrix algeriensis]